MSINLCNTIFQQHEKSTLVMHQGASKRCWHCHHPFKCDPVSIPITESEMHGTFCSLECAKSYIYMMKRFDENLLLMNLSHVYKAKNIRCAPSFQFLDVYGGHLTIEQFRSYGGIARPHPVTKPYITYPMCMETRESTQEEEGEPKIALYDEYLAKRKDSQPKSQKSSKKGTLTQFLK